ncbi:Clathrin interactor EPSIN 2 [Heracleum sosnowskyi]|uniref:Clathrin interactor EPSIN 2 n=1 Tax=Heracleum sosnowskyi TaxID=360622 RepID=A0AAD8GNL7_9APIA|nr:Clathrin interactor EPSIN 2 [Heracleum sosnowskyi]
MKKALGQTVRDLKREVNKKVLKVPSIEQKVLDATSNEPWGPHGSHLADIAQASRNYHEYQMIMSVLWKRINDTGKNWRHVYKALTVLEYLVANGTERVIDEIREHAYQISTLSDFQYIDSSGRDQGSNVRKKSQSLVVLVNDKERIQEVREKAAANREKYRNTSTGGMYKPGSYTSGGGYGERYEDDRYEGSYGSRDEDPNGYGREREWRSRENDRYGKYGDSSNHERDQYGRESEERYGRDGYKDNSSRGRSQNGDDYNYGARSRSSDRGRDRSYEDDGQYSSSVADRRAEQIPAAPPSYEEVVGEASSPPHGERNGEASKSVAPKLSAPSQNASERDSTFSRASTDPVPAASAMPVPAASAAPAPAASVAPASATSDFDGGFNAFDPRGTFSAAPTSASSADVDFFGSTSESFSSNSLAIVPTETATTEFNAFTNSGSNQTSDDPFGDGPFRAISTVQNFPTQSQIVESSPSFQHGKNYSETPTLTSQNTETVSNFGFGNTDILADILPPSGPSTGFPAQILQPTSQSGFASQTGPPPSHTGFQGQSDQYSSSVIYPPHMGQASSSAAFPAQGQLTVHTTFPFQSGQPASFTSFPSQMGTAQPSSFAAPSQPSLPAANIYGNPGHLSGPAAPAPAPVQSPQSFAGTPANYNQMNSQYGIQMTSQMQQAGISTSTTLAPTLPATDSLAIIPEPANDKFETKSTVWADTLNRGLVDLNISGSKTNPLADIGVDFDAINRKEKRMEKPSQKPVVSTINMGKAMGSGSGIGRAGASALRGAPNPMIGTGMSMIRGPSAGMGIGIGGGYGVNQPMGGMVAGMNLSMAGGMNIGMRPGVAMQQQSTGFPQGPTMGGYNPMMGPGFYGQQPYNGGYR